MLIKSGEYEMQRDKAKIYYTFKPTPLCKVNFIKTDEELTLLLSKAHRVLGILEGMTRFIPNMDVTESILMKKEILLSCQLDGSKASFDDVLHNTKKKNKDIIYIQQFRNIRRKKHEKIYGYDFGLVLGFLVRDDSICSNWI